MHGPPMSMFSIASASVTPGFATVCSNGYRLHTTRSISNKLCSASVVMCSGLSRFANRPA